MTLFCLLLTCILIHFQVILMDSIGCDSICFPNTIMKEINYLQHNILSYMWFIDVIKWHDFSDQLICLKNSSWFIRVCLEVNWGCWELLWTNSNWLTASPSSRVCFSQHRENQKIAHKNHLVDDKEENEKSLQNIIDWKYYQK